MDNRIWDLPDAARRRGMSHGEWMREMGRLAERGDTRSEIAKEFDVPVAELRRWERDIEGVREVLKAGWKVRAERVEEGIYENAIGGNVSAQQFILERKARAEWGRNTTDEAPTRVPLEEVWLLMRKTGEEIERRLALQRGVTVDGEVLRGENEVESPAS